MPACKSPFALIQEIREWFDGPLALSGAIATGGAVLAAQAMGADFAYIGSAFIATEEARAADGLQADDRREHAATTSSTRNLFTGVHGNYLKRLDRAAGLDPDEPARERPEQDELRRRRDAKAWKDIWGCGQGIGAVKEVVPARGAGRAAAARVRGGARAALALSRLTRRHAASVTLATALVSVAVRAGATVGRDLKRSFPSAFRRHCEGKAGRNPPTGRAGPRKVSQPTAAPETGAKGERR